MSATDRGFLIALSEAQQSVDEGGIPVGSAIVSSSGEVLGQGRNSRVQRGSVILHVSSQGCSHSQHIIHINETWIETCTNRHLVSLREKLLPSKTPNIIPSRRSKTQRFTRPCHHAICALEPQSIFRSKEW
jgi:hypothetical protein